MRNHPDKTETITAIAGFVALVMVLLAPVRAGAGEGGLLGIRLQPGARLGSHMSGVGLAANLSREREILGLTIGASAFATLHYDGTYFGPRKNGGVFTFGFGGRAGFGPALRAGGRGAGDAPVRRHELEYVWQDYLDNWGSSQYTGKIGYTYNAAAFSAGMGFEDDFFAGRGADDYRTAAVEMTFAFGSPLKGNKPSGSAGSGNFGGRPRICTGIKLWTGGAQGNAAIAPGVQPSAGIAYGGVGWGPVTVRLGWDSDEIRNFFQNNAHRLLGNKVTPYQRGDKGRLYFSVDFFGGESLY
jgi:hypothetical protein